MKNHLLEKRINCMARDCRARALYGLYKIQPNGHKIWAHVCKLHEGSIGDQNMRIRGFDPRTGNQI